MTKSPNLPHTVDFERFHHNPFKDLLWLSKTIHQILMDKSGAAGFHGLKLSFGQIIPLIGPNGVRIVDLARYQGVSKQAIGQVVSEIEKMGYVEKIDDPDDGRSKTLVLTKQGRDLVKVSATHTRELYTTLAQAAGADQVDTLLAVSTTLYEALGLSNPQIIPMDIASNQKAFIASLIPGLAHFCQQRLIADLQRRGHTELKLSYSQVLPYIGNEGIRVNQLAELNGITKQAVSQACNELESLDYIKRVDDPADKRAKLLLFSRKGIQLVEDSLAGIAVLQTEWEQLVGTEAYSNWAKALARLHERLTPVIQITGTATKISSDSWTAFLDLVAQPNHWNQTPKGRFCPSDLLKNRFSSLELTAQQLQYLTDLLTNNVS